MDRRKPPSEWSATIGEGLNGLDAEEGVVLGLLQQRLARQAQTARAAGSSGARPQRRAA